MDLRTTRRAILALLAGALLLPATAGSTQDAAGPALVSPGGTRIRVLLDESALGGPELEVAEITFAPGTDSGNHVHGSTEVFYVLSGELEHVVNGRSQILKPGMIGHVRPPDEVRHRTGPGEPTKALVMWAPAGEAGRITASWRREP